MFMLQFSNNAFVSQFLGNSLMRISKKHFFEILIREFQKTNTNALLENCLKEYVFHVKRKLKFKSFHCPTGLNTS